MHKYRFRFINSMIGLVQRIFQVGNPSILAIRRCDGDWTARVILFVTHKNM